MFASEGLLRATVLSIAISTLGCDDALVLLGLGPENSGLDSATAPDTGNDGVVVTDDATMIDALAESSLDAGTDGADGADASDASLSDGQDGDDGSNAREAGDGGDAEAAPFGSIAEVAELGVSGAEDFKPTLTADMLEIYFRSNRDGGPGSGDVWQAVRADAGSLWGAPTCVTQVSSPYSETSPAVSADGLTLWVASDRDGGIGGFDIWVSSRSNRKSAWSTPTWVKELSSPMQDIPRPPGLNDLVMPLAIAPLTDAGQAQYQTYTASRASVGGSWSTPNRLSSIDTANVDTDGFFSNDGLGIYFSSDRVTSGHQELFFATRPDPASPFASFQYLSELSGSGHQDRDPWVSPDGHQIYFSSDRSGILRIYHAVR